MKQPIPNPALRAISATLALLQVLGSTPLLGSQTPVTSSQSEGSAVALAADQPAPEQPRAVSLTSKPAPLSFSPQPTDAEFFSASLFAVPLCAIGRASPAENRAPADSLLAYSARTDSEDNSTLTQFLDHFPQSPWKPALLVNLGIAWRQTGYFSRAMEAWAEAWELSKRVSGLGGRALADRAFGELVQINACVGRYEKLEPLLAEVRDRPLTGGATEMLAGAREGAVDYEQQAGPRLMFLTAIQDSAQNTVQIHYDTNIINGNRIDMVTDAVGQQTHLYYDLPTADEPLLAFRITRVIDPFQRTAYFDYDKNSNLRKITDVIGISSVFTYAPGSFINEMVTPYGLTAFSYADLDALGRSLTITDPNGDREYIIYQNANAAIPDISGDVPANLAFVGGSELTECNTFYLDKKAMATSAYDLANATIYHWAKDDSGAPSSIIGSRLLESIKPPLENRIWFLYGGRTASYQSQGVTLRAPILVARVVEDSAGTGGKSTQAYQMAYGANGNLTSFTDPLGRQTTFDFYANGIDLQKVRQTTPAPPLGTAINQTVAEFGTYNAQHRPSSYADASRQTDSLFWNSLGQITTNIPPETSGKLTQYIYTGFHYVKEINEMCIACNGCPCTPRTTSLSHDSFGRLSSMSDSEGYSVTYDYDALDRLTKISYPDQTLIKSN